MERKILAVLVLGLVSLGAGMTAWAHHSFSAVFDTNQPVTVRGVIAQARLENPHSWFFLEVRDAGGNVEKWAFEAGTPSGMIRNGFKPGMICPFFTAGSGRTRHPALGPLTGISNRRQRSAIS